MHKPTTLNKECLVTIGIPSYNRHDGLVRITTQLKSQTYSNFNVIISDNASPDPRVRVFCEYLSIEDRRFRYHIHTQNIGAIDNHSFLLGIANTP